MTNEDPTASYPATATHAELGGAALTGNLWLQSHALLFESAAANCGIPLERLEIQEDQSGGVLFTDRDQPEWSIRTAELRVLQHPIIQSRNHLRTQAQAIRRAAETRRQLRLSGVFLLAIVLAGMVLWSLSSWAVDLMVDMVPVSTEVQLGKSVLAEIRKSVRVDASPGEIGPIETVSEALLRAQSRRRYRFEFLIVDSMVPNAIALPGGKILVCRGLLKFVDRPEQLAGVLAHEMAHVTRRHGLRQVIAAGGRYYLLRLFISDRSGFLTVLSEATQLLVRQSFSRQFENEADAEGFGYLAKANIDPRGLEEFLRKLANDPKWSEPGSPALRIFDSHPPTPERLEHLEALWRQWPNKAGFVKLPTGPTPNDP